MGGRSTPMRGIYAPTEDGRQKLHSILNDPVTRGPEPEPEVPKDVEAPAEGDAGPEDKQAKLEAMRQAKAAAFSAQPKNTTGAQAGRAARQKALQVGEAARAAAIDFLLTHGGWTPQDVEALPGAIERTKDATLQAAPFGLPGAAYAAGVNASLAGSMLAGRGNVAGHERTMEGISKAYQDFMNLPQEAQDFIQALKGDE